MKRLYRSRTDRMLAGVIGGLGEYYNTDPTILRLVYIALTIISFGVPGVFAYIIAAVIVPVKPDVIIMNEDGKAVGE